MHMVMQLLQPVQKLLVKCIYMKVYRLSLEDGFIVNWISFYRPAFPSKCQDEALAQHLDTGIDSSTRGLIYLCLLK